ncbi:MAG: saccharopine dehydrogenase NADP-binding domain-containing protein [Chthoniobacterales bacterium]|nr:saccharopine dehydrogenase NADP-binding domain-containing protein [Chthoniobacterales bacterium]
MKPSDSSSRAKGTVTLFGAYGHTGRFVIAELLRRGITPILAGRDPTKLDTLAENYPTLPRRVASVEDPVSLDRALQAAQAVVNCAGPFLDTAAPVIEAALRARIHYVDVAAEQTAVFNTFERYDERARQAGILVTPALAFYGGLSDLLATAAMRDWESADTISVAVALDSWQPTLGTRLTGERNPGQRFVFSHGKLARADSPPSRTWTFPEPFGLHDVVSVPLAESITMPRHLRISDIYPYINVAPLADLSNPETPAPTPADERGRSAQVFLVEVVVQRGPEERRAIARGRDIYWVTAPIVVEAVERILAGKFTRPGTVPAAEAFDARDFLDELSAAECLSIEYR